MKKSSASKGIIKDIAIVAIGVLIVWIGMHVVSGTPNPFYVVASGSMIPELKVYDVLIVQGDCFSVPIFTDSKDCIRLDWYVPFDDIQIGDVIVFDRPSDHNKVIVHRVVAIINDDPKTVKTKGDANISSISGTDYPITEKDYIGIVIHTLPQVGYVTQVLKPPINFVIIAIVIGVMILKQITKTKKEKETKSLDSKDQDTSEELTDIDKIERDSRYSEHAKRSETTKDEKVDGSETVSDGASKTDEKDKE